MNEKKFKEAIRTILTEIGEDVNREGIKATPDRVCRLWKNLYYGYRKRLVVMNENKRNKQKLPDDVIPITVFKSISNDLLIRKVNFLSTCEHHLAQIHSGECWVGIVPNQKLAGMNKIDKIVKYFAARLQIQEKMTCEIADWINTNLEPLGVIVLIKANHLCAELQGDNGHFITSSARGILLNNKDGVKDEFLSLIKT